MKIGLSYSRCVRDILEGKVDINDVLLLITRTDFDPHNDEQWAGIFSGYCGGSMWNMNMEWNGLADKEQELRDITKNLYDSGRMHQPRQFGAHPRRLPHIWLETILPSEDLENNPTVKAAWNKFQVLAGLTNIDLDEDHVAS